MNLFAQEFDGVFAVTDRPVGVRSPVMPGRMDPRCFNSKSSSESRASQITGGTQSGSAAQANGTKNTVNTGTVTTVTNTNRNQTATNSGNKIGNNSVVTYNTGLSADDLGALIGNLLSPQSSTNLGGANGGGGVFISTTPPASTVQTTALSSLAKWGIGLIALVLLWLGVRGFRSKSSK